MTKTDKNENQTNQTELEPYKVEEFDKFIETIKGGAVGHWIQIARVLGIANSTIHSWKKLPQAQKAIKDAIERTAEKMEESGKDDWRMWESKMKMLGVSPIEKAETDVTSDGKRIEGFNYLPPKEDAENNSNNSSNDQTA